MNRITNKNIVAMLEDALNYSDEENAILKENYILETVISTKDGIERQITETLAVGRHNAILYYAKFVSPTKWTLEKVAAWF